MSRILFTWELGAGSGHVLRLLPLAQELARRGHSAQFAVKDLSRTGALLNDLGHSCLQAPLWLPTARGMPTQLNYADILAHAGYLDANGLRGLVLAWRSLYSLIRPDLILFEHAPTALLAARAQGITRAIIGTGFVSPPRTTPLPALRFDRQRPLPSEQLMRVESKVLDSINTVLSQLGEPGLDRLSDLLAAEERFLCTFPEFDHYPQRGDAHYWGPMFTLDQGEAPVWPLGDRPRVFAYIYPTYPGFAQLMQAFQSLPLSTLVYAPGLATKERLHFESANLRLSPHPFNMAKTRAKCDFAVCHAGFGTVLAMLLSGRPLLSLPTHDEQALVARLCETLGAGLTGRPQGKASDYKKLLKQLATEKRFGDAAKQFASRYAGYTQQAQIEKMADRCEELLTDK